MPTAGGNAVRLNEDELNRFGETVGASVRPPVVVGLSGDLGTGKTTLVQAMCRGLGARARATSPTYALVHESETAAGVPIYHVDCYRLERPDEARELGFDDMIREGAVVLIEWPERAGLWAPRLDRHFRLRHGPRPDLRELEEAR